MKKELSIEYAHIYTNNQIGEEQKLSLDILNTVTHDHKDKSFSLVVMVDDYSFPDPTFSYSQFTEWLGEKGFKPDSMIRESQLIPLCDEVHALIQNEAIKNELTQYVKAKKYPCSLFVAAWYLLRLGYLKNTMFNEENVAEHLKNILPISFKPYEEKAFDIIRATPYADAVSKIENIYFEGRSI